ncbi:MAG: hypothetical protein ACFB0C_03130 [Leptolyngbyaceae cyanobacterium]
MVASNKFYWLAYTFVSSALVLPVVVLGITSPTSLEALLTTGGFIESLPAVVNLLGAILAILLAIKTKEYLFWGFYSVCCFFLAGEEAAWGRDSVLGWQIRRSFDPEQSGDIHNIVSDALVANISVSAACAVLVGIVFTICLVFLKLKKRNQAIIKELFNYFSKKSTDIKFMLFGSTFILLGMIDFVQEFFGLPYIPGQWSAEESFELLGSVALLFAIIVKLF